MTNLCTQIGDIFLVGYQGGFFHYNGTDYYRYPQFQGFPYNIYRVWSDGHEVFAINEDELHTNVLHGR